MKYSQKYNINKNFFKFIILKFFSPRICEHESIKNKQKHSLVRKKLNVIKDAALCLPKSNPDWSCAVNTRTAL